jgi:uncharacterized protein (TIGR01655 family)
MDTFKRVHKFKRPLLAVLVVAAIALIAASAVWGRQYYEDRYVASDYYAQIPADFSAKPRMLLDMNGNIAGMEGVDYELTAFDADGQSRLLCFTVREGLDYPQASTYVRVQASPQLVTGWEIIDRTEVPQSVLDRIDGG